MNKDELLKEFNDKVEDLRQELLAKIEKEEKKLAEQHLKEQRLLFKIKKWAEIHNEGWKPDWSDYSNNKYLIYYDEEDGLLRISAGRISNTLSSLPILKTREIAQECIDIFGDEIKEVLC